MCPANSAASKQIQTLTFFHDDLPDQVLSCFQTEVDFKVIFPALSNPPDFSHIALTSQKFINIRVISPRCRSAKLPALKINMEKA
ncbi:MAG TPA: hypothetical protein DCZ94_22450 [Lentisphaeria bacterium]|nr:MAG: hypothetical protein A2X48_13690 [Lentisphaerae bacterium GWF2_49_21]HBC89710.1 hypothetical protein [Lentisphaeria bacterium]